MRWKEPWFKLKQQSLMDVNLRKLFKNKYVSTIMMLTKNDNFCNWIECHMCEDYWLMNKQMLLDKYVMPLPKETIGQGKARFSTLWTCDLITIHCHQGGGGGGDKVKTSFRGVDMHGKICLYQWQFLPFGLKNTFAKFQRVMDKVLVGLNFVKCYINDIIILNLIP